MSCTLATALKALRTNCVPVKFSFMSKTWKRLHFIGLVLCSASKILIKPAGNEGVSVGMNHWGTHGPIPVQSYRWQPAWLTGASRMSGQCRSDLHHHLAEPGWTFHPESSRCVLSAAAAECVLTSLRKPETKQDLSQLHLLFPSGSSVQRILYDGDQLVCSAAWRARRQFICFLCFSENLLLLLMTTY